MDTKQAFEDMPVAKAVLVNAVPAVLSMLVTLIYNVADTFFIGQTGDEMQVAAVSLATPVFLLFMAIGTLYGIGGTSVISRAFGEGRDDFARTVGSFCFWMSVFTGILCILVFLSGMDYILQWIGASGNTEGYARTYLSCVAWSAPFVIVSSAFSNIVRAGGKVERGHERGADRYRAEHRARPCVHTVARLRHCRRGMGHGHRLYGSHRILRSPADRQTFRPDHIPVPLQPESGNGGSGICHRHSRLAELAS